LKEILQKSQKIFRRQKTPINRQQATGSDQKANRLLCVPRIFQHLKDMSLDNDNNSPFARNACETRP